MKEKLKLRKKEKKVRMSKEEKLAKKQEKIDKYANKKGIAQFYSTYIFETIYIFLIEICFKLFYGNFAFDYSLLRIFISSLIFSLILTLVTNNLNQKVRKSIILFFNLFVTFDAWLQLGFEGFLGAFMSMGNAGQGTKITDYILDFLCAYNWKVHLLYIPFILSIIYFVHERYIICDGYNKKIDFKSLINNLIFSIYFLILCLFFYCTISLDFMQGKHQVISNKELFKYPSNPALTIKNFGTTVYFFLDLKGLIFGEGSSEHAVNLGAGKSESKTREIDDSIWEKLIEEEKDEALNILNNYFIRRNISEKNEYTGKFKDKNLIFIMLESISVSVFDEEYKEYFPTLYKLYNEGITGVNNYSPRNNCATGDSEMTSQISLYSIGTTCTVNTYKKNIYPEAIMSMFKNNGYYTSAYHNYNDQYYDRNVIENNFGSIDYFGIDDLKVKYSYLYQEWPSDLEFMEKALPKFIEKEKFASYMVTVTAHTPYNYASKTGDDYVHLFKDLDLTTPAKRYLSKVKHADLALEHLLKQLEEKGILDDTVLVIFGDHYPYGLSDKQYQSLTNFDININQEIDRTPFIIYNSATEAERITKVTTPLDYAPTLLNLFGIKYDPRHYMGNDVFSDYIDFAVFPDNSWQSSYGFYDASKDEFIKDEDSKKSYTSEEIIEINKEINDLKNMSTLAIKKNYFKYLYKYFEDNKEIELNTDTEE